MIIISVLLLPHLVYTATTALEEDQTHYNYVQKGFG